MAESGTDAESGWSLWPGRTARPRPWRTSSPRTQKMMSSAMLVAWSAIRSRWRVARINCKPGLTKQATFVSPGLQIFKDAVAVLIDYVVTFQNLRGHFDVAKNECAEALADH